MDMDLTLNGIDLTVPVESAARRQLKDPTRQANLGE
jgi:hypothetical protein